jgi:gliding motility-associated-like protein
MKQLISTFGLLLLLGGAALGQINPPNFLCVSNDTLVWEVPTNPCGPFNAYLVYASQQPNGPFTLLATITDPNQERFFHQNAGSTIWYYYLESDFNCPGQPVLQSDTLDNRNPEPPVLESASVSESNVRLIWLLSPSPEVIGYVISRNVPGQGTTIIDTVFGTNNYVDTSADPENRSETYFIEAIDACGNKSLVAPPHSTMVLSAEESDPCERTITLSWNRYEGWPSGPSGHEVWVSRDGALHQRFATIAGNATSYVFPDVDDGVEYCFVIHALRDGNVFAASSAVCITGNVVQAIRHLAVTNATVDGNGSVQLEWVWNANAQLNQVDILRARAGGNLETVRSAPPPMPLGTGSSYADNQANPAAGPLSYEVHTTDACGVVTVSNAATTIHLQATPQAGINTLNWTPYGNPLGIAQGYDLYRLGAGGAPELLNSFNPNLRQTTDAIDLSDPNQVRACYYIEARAIVTILDTVEIEVLSRSNLACAEQEAKVYVPNAFSPNDDGRNDTFQPFLQFGQPADYLMAIYDRWGNQLFETRDFQEGWDGRSRGKNAPVGLYAYYIRIEQANGQVFERSGEVSLLR